MESQQGQLTDDTSNSSSLVTAFEPKAGRQISPTTQSIAKGRWIITQIFSFLEGLPGYVGSWFNKYKQPIISIGVICGVAIALRVVVAILDALDDIPVVAPTFELVGVGYSVWFISRYLLKSSTRQELAQKLEGVLKQQD